MKHSTTNTPGTTASSLPVLCFLPFWGPPQLCWDACTHVASDRSGRACRRGLGRGIGAGVTRAVRARAPMSTGPSAAARVSSFAPHDVGSGHTCSGRQKFVADSSRAEGARTYPCAKLHHPCNKNFYLPLKKKLHHPSSIAARGFLSLPPAPCGYGHLGLRGRRS